MGNRKSYITYDCILLDEKSIALLSDLINKNITEPGFEIIPQSNMHCTLRFFTSNESRSTQLTNENLGKNINIAISEIGIYKKDGIIQNIGFRVDVDNTSLDNHFFTNEISHITYAINTEEKAKAVNTQKCFGLNLEEGESYEVIKLPRQILLDGKTAGMHFDTPIFELDESVPSKEELLEKITEIKQIEEKSGKDSKKYKAAVEKFMLDYGDYIDTSKGLDNIEEVR